MIIPSTFPAFIHAVGPKTLALVLNVSESTIYSYASRGRIPRSKWPDLLAEYMELGMKQLLEMEAADAERDA